MSALADAATDYLRLRRSLGHKLNAAGRLLPRYVAYLDGLDHDTVTIATALAWATDVNVGTDQQRACATDGDRARVRPAHERHRRPHRDPTAWSRLPPQPSPCAAPVHRRRDLGRDEPRRRVRQLAAARRHAGDAHRTARRDRHAGR